MRPIDFKQLAEQEVLGSEVYDVDGRTLLVKVDYNDLVNRLCEIFAIGYRECETAHQFDEQARYKIVD